MAKCIGCPAAKQMDADNVVANVLGLATGSNYRSESEPFHFYSPIPFAYFN